MSDANPANGNGAVKTEEKKAPVLSLETVTEEPFNTSILGFHTDQEKIANAVMSVLGLDVDENGNPQIAGNGYSSKNGIVESNVNINDFNVPDGFGVMIVPITERDTSEKKLGNVTKAIGVYVVPTMDAVMAYGEGKGREFVVNAYEQALLRKLTPAVKTRRAGNDVALPSKLEEFVESQRGGTDGKAFTKLAPKMVAALKQRGLSNINPNILKMVLSSKAAATALFPKFENSGNWVKVLNILIAEATKENLDVTQMNNWLATRDQTAMDAEQDVELSDDDLTKALAA